MQKPTPNPCTLIRDNDHPGSGTVLVLGTPRGGTSVVAGICHMLGVPMGLDIDESNVEDKEFQRLLSEPDVRSAAERFFSNLFESRALAGVKNPAIIDRLVEFYSVIPQPILIVVSRDVYASAQREEVSGSEFFTALRESIRRKYAILGFMVTADAPQLVVSYERLMAEPERAVEGIAKFIGVEPDAELLRLTTACVLPNADMPHDVNFVEARRRFEQSLMSG